MRACSTPMADAAPTVTDAATRLPLATVSAAIPGIALSSTNGWSPT